MGMLVVAALIPGPLRLGAITLDSATLLLAVAAVLVGTQLVLFYVVARCAAVTAGLLPANERFQRMNEAISVDRFCLVGGGLFVVGLIIALGATIRWTAAGFGDLDAGVNIRFAAVATLLMALGVQSVTAGFLVGLVRTRKAPAADARSDDGESPSAKAAEARARKDEAA
jgi:hypothetical protein